MKIYQGFAEIYDNLMFDAPYDEWVGWIDKWINEKLQLSEQSGASVAPNCGALTSNESDAPNCGALTSNESDAPYCGALTSNESDAPYCGASARIIVDLGCGTGSVLVRLAKMGYSVIGVDSSVEMLGIAQEKAAPGTLFINQDLRNLDLYGTAHAFVSVCDVMNYILNTESLQKVFERVHLFLEPGGLFIFDMNTIHKYRDKMTDKIFSGSGLGGESYVWKNRFCNKTMINEYNVTFHCGVNNAVFTEKHLQKAYESSVVENLLKLAGFQSVEVRCGYSDKPLSTKSIRAVYIAQK